MKYIMIEVEKACFTDEVNKRVKKGMRPIWETFRQYVSMNDEHASVILEDPEGQTTLVKKKK